MAGGDEKPQRFFSFSSYKQGYQHFPCLSAICLISLDRVSGAVIKGYEKDVGTKTSFYGFTAYSLVSSLQNLEHKGFKKIPQGKVSQVYDCTALTGFC